MQCTTQQHYTKPRHQPSNRDQQTRDKLRNNISKSKAKIKSRAYIQLGLKTLQTVHQTFEPNIPGILHLPALTNTTVDTDSIPMLFVIQEGRHCMPTTDYYFMNIQPDPIIVSPHRRNHSELTVQCTATRDQIPQQTHPLKLGKTRVYPSMLADKQVPVLDLTNSTITSHADLQAVFQSLHLCSTKEDELSHGRKESKEDTDTDDYLSDSDSSEEETCPHLRTSPKERLYHTVKGSAQATQVALAHTTAQCNPTVERGPAKQPKIKKLPKEQASDKLTQTEEKDKSH